MPPDVIEEITVSSGIVSAVEVERIVAGAGAGDLLPGQIIRAVRDVAVVVLRERGWSLTDIGQQFGVTRERVRQLVHPVDGPPVVRGPIHRVLRDDMAANPDWPLNRIAQRRGMTLTTFLRHLPPEVVEMVVRTALARLPDGQQSMAAVRRETGLPVSVIRAALTVEQYAALSHDIAGRVVRRDFTDDALVAAVTTAAAAGGSGDAVGLTEQSYTRWRAQQPEGRYPSASLITVRFGSWNAAVLAAGLTPTRLSRRAAWWTTERKQQAVSYYLTQPGVTGTAADYVRWRDRVAPAAPSLALLRRGLPTSTWNAVLESAAGVPVSGEVRHRLESGDKYRTLARRKNSDQAVMRERDATLLGQWIEGSTITALVDEYGLSKSRIRQIVRRATQQQQQQAAVVHLALSGEGVTRNELTERSGLTEDTLQRCLPDRDWVELAARPARRTAIPQQVMEAALRAAADGETRLSIAAYERWRAQHSPPAASVSAIIRRYGSWRTAVAAVLAGDQ